VSDGFLRTLGTPPQLGRELNEEETRLGGGDAAIISAGLWRRMFAERPGVLGQTITLDDGRYTVVGVLPDQFWFPQPAEVLIPLRRAGDLNDRGTNTQTVARLRDGVELAGVREELTGMMGALRTLWGENRGNYGGITPTSFHDFLVGGVRLNLLLLLGATGLVFLIAVSDVAVMLLARLAARRRDLAVRLALGGGVPRIAGELLAENLVLAAIGGGLGAAFAYVSVAAFVAWLPLSLPPVPVTIDGAVFVFVFSAIVGTVVLLTLASAGSVRRLGTSESLSSVAGRSRGEGRSRTRQVLTVTEVALSTVLLSVAGLLGQSLYKLHRQPLGFAPEGLVTFITPLTPELGSDAVAREEFTRVLAGSLSEIPGVRAVAAANVLPLTGDQYNVPSQRDGRPEFSFGGVEVRVVTPSYFDAMRIPLVRGRGFTETDASPTASVAVINETLVRMWWAEEEAIGDRVVIGTHENQQHFPDPSREVVGVIADGKTIGLRAAPRPTVFVTHWGALPVSALSWILRAEGEPPPDFGQRIRTAVDAVDPAQRIIGSRTVDEVVASAAGPWTFNAQLFGAFAALAVLLAAIGLYGVLSFLVGQRRREIGTRMALGATSASVARRFLAVGLVLTLTGVILGLGGALAISRLLSALLFEIEPHDPVSFGAVAVLLLTVGLLASYVPAQRAARTDPMRVLKGD
jgi:putative ABC transport system permease protein